MKNVPNILSSIRILMVPLFIVVYFSDIEYARRWAAVVYAAASATDVLDGYIARKYNIITNLGRILDPLGDKLMAIAMVTCLTIDGRVPYWALGFYAAKELVMMICGAFIHKGLHKDMPSANVLGKAATASLFVVGVVLMLFDIPRDAADSLITFAICIAFMAFGSYALNFLGTIKKPASGERDDNNKE